jgi:hypothetical protein
MKSMTHEIKKLQKKPVKIKRILGLQQQQNNAGNFY